MNEDQKPQGSGKGVTGDAPAAEPKRSRVLLVGDEPLTREILLFKLRRAGLEVETATNGSLALKRLGGPPLDALFLDLMMPDILGAEVIKEARRDKRFGQKPIYVCNNGLATSAWSRQAVKVGATKVFDKITTSVDTIVSEVASALRESGATAIPNPSAVESTALHDVPAELQAKVAWLCNELKQLTQCQDNDARAHKVGKLLRHALSVVSCAATTGKHQLARGTLALEGFLQELCEKPKRFTDSSIRTLTTALEALEVWSKSSRTDQAAPSRDLAAVVVDAGLFSRNAMSKALREASFTLNTFVDPGLALDHLRKNPADLVVADLIMPKMNGIDLQEKLKVLPGHAQTPLILVAGPKDLKRTARRPSGPNAELIVKPFVSSELVLKALSLVMKNSTPHQSGSPSPQSTTAAPDPERTRPATSVKPTPPASPAPAPGAKSATATGEIAAMLLCPDVGVVLFDQSLKIISSNDVCATMFGWPQLAGKEVEILFKGGLQNELGRVLKQDHPAGESTERFSFRLTALRKGGQEFNASVILTRTSSGSKTCWTAVFQELDENVADEGQTAILHSATGELQKQCHSMATEAAMHREALEDLQKERDQLQQQLHDATAAKTDLENQLAEQTMSQEMLSNSFSDFREELDKARAALESKEKEFQQEVAQGDRLKEELLSLRETCESLTNKLNGEHETAIETRQQGEELRKRLRETVEELGRVKAELQQQKDQTSPASAELQDQLNTARAAAEQAEAAWQEEAERNTRLEAESQNLHQSNEELKSRLQAAEKAAAQSTQDTSEWENQLRESRDEIARLKAELETQAQAPTPQADTDGQSEVLRAELQQLRDNESSLEAERAELENQVRERAAALARTSAELERERRERRRIEQRTADLTSQLQEMHDKLKQHLESENATQTRLSDLDRQLHERQEEVARFTHDLQRESADRQAAEEQLQALGDVQGQLEQYRGLLEESKQTFQKVQDDLETRLQNSLRALNESEANLQKELAERKRLEEAFGTAQRTSQEQSEQKALELAKLQSDLQVEQLERKRLEGEVKQARPSTIDSGRVGRTLLNSLRRQIRQPVEEILQSARNLLDGDLPEDQKGVLESMLENALMVQANLQETGTTHIKRTPDQAQDAAPASPSPEEPGQVNQAA